MSHSKNSSDLKNLFQSAAKDGIISSQTSSILTGDLGAMVIAGAAGTSMDDIVASDVTLMTILVDKSSSIGYSKLAASVRDGYNSLLDAVSSSREKDSILTALWTFNSSAAVVHAYVPIQDAQRLDRFNYQPSGSTALFDTWCDALAANVAYAQRLRDGGTPCRSVVVIITDGEDTASRRHAADCERLSRDLLRSEQFVLAFVGVGSEASFKRIAGSMGIPKGSVHVQTQVQATAIRQTFQLVSQSAIRASQGKILPGPQAGFFQP